MQNTERIIKIQISIFIFLFFISFISACSIESVSSGGNGDDVELSAPVISVSFSEDGETAYISIDPTEGADGYQIYMKSVDDSKYKKVLVIEKSGKKDCVATISGLESGQAYCFKVKAFSKTEEGKIWSKYSNEIEETATVVNSDICPSPTDGIVPTQMVIVNEPTIIPQEPTQTAMPTYSVIPTFTQEPTSTGYPIFLFDTVTLVDTMREDSDGRMITVSREARNTNGQKVYYDGLDGYWWRCRYDENGQKVYQLYSDGSWERWEYDKNGEEVFHELSDGKWEKHEYDSEGNLTFNNSEGEWARWEYDKNGRTTYYEDYGGYKYRYTYEADGDETIVHCIDAAGAETTSRAVYDEQGRITLSYHSDGSWTRYEYDAYGNLSYQEYSNGSWYLYEYDSRGHQLRYEHYDEIFGHSETQREYDENGYLTMYSEWDPYLGKDAYQIYEYNSHGDVVSIVDMAGVEGKTTRFEYKYQQVMDTELPLPTITQIPENVDLSMFLYWTDSYGAYIWGIAEDYRATIETLDIPETIEGRPVKRVGGVQRCSNLTNIKMPNSVTKIELGITDNPKLTEIILSDNITEIPEGAFARNKSLNKVVLPKNLVSIGNGAFEKCESLQNIVIPDGVTTIGDNIFRGCTNLVSIQLPRKLHHLGLWVFDGCEKLVDVVLPEGLVYIDQYAFDGCYDLQEIAIPGSVVYINDHAFECCMSLKKVLLSEGLETIGKQAFSKCYAMESINIPNSIYKIGDDVFSGCKKLKITDYPKDHVEVQYDYQGVPYVNIKE